MVCFFLMIRRPPRSTQSRSSAASDVYKRQGRVYQIVTTHPAYFYADQEVLITCDASGSVSAWFDGHMLTLEEVEKRSRQAVIVSSKSEHTSPLPPAYDHPWRTYGKKINGKPVLTTLSTQ